MSHIQEIPRYKCQGGCVREARYEVVNDRSAVLGRFCKRCAERELYKFRRDAATWGGVEAPAVRRRVGKAG